jgi:hypothetical protein
LNGDPGTECIKKKVPVIMSHNVIIIAAKRLIKYVFKLSTS